MMSVLYVVFLILIDYLSNTGYLDSGLGNTLKALSTVVVFLLGIRLKLPVGLGLYAALMMLLVMKTFLHPNVNFVVSSRESFKLLVLPFWLIFVINQKSRVNLILWFVFVVSFMIYVELLPAGGAVYDLSIYESSGEGFVGIFANAHSAGLCYVTLSSITLLHYLRYRSKLSLILLLLFGSFAFLSFVRTAWVPLVALLIYFISRLSYSKKTTYKLMLILFIVVVLAALQSEVFLDRLLDRNKFRQSSSVENLGSNRILLWLTNLDLILNSGSWNIIWGLGRELAFVEMEKALGFSKVSHNIILDVFVREGILGLIIYLLGIRQLILWVRKNSNRGLNIVFNILFFSWFLFQGTSFFMFDVFLAFFIAEIYKYKNEVYLFN